MTIRPVDKSHYDVEYCGHPVFHENLGWYARHDDVVLGVLVHDKIDRDYSWVILTQNDQGPGYTAIDVRTSLSTLESARDELFEHMERYSL